MMMMMMWLVLFIIFPGLAFAKATATTNSKVVVHLPRNNNNINRSHGEDGGLEHWLMPYSLPAVEGSIVQTLWYVHGSLYNNYNPDYTKNSSLSTVWYKPPHGTSTSVVEEPQAPGKIPFILMLDWSRKGGACNMLQQIQQAQQAGAAAVIIANQWCVSHNDNDSTACQAMTPALIADGLGVNDDDSGISIPVVVLSKTTADHLIAELYANHPVLVEISWSQPAHHVVHYSLWTLPLDEFSQEFLRTFKSMAVALGDRAAFTPHYYIYDGQRAGCTTGNCPGLCTNHGRYCATNATDTLPSISGADIVAESLRRMCIWKHYSGGGVSQTAHDQNGGVGEPWWDYVMDFMAHCQDSEYFTKVTCIQNVCRRAGVDWGVIKLCMAESGGLDGNNPNVMLEDALTEEILAGVILIPSFLVEDRVVRERLTSKNVFNAICNVYDDDDLPKICCQCMDCPNILACVREGICSRTCNETVMAAGTDMRNTQQFVHENTHPRSKRTEK